MGRKRCVQPGRCRNASKRRAIDAGGRSGEDRRIGEVLRRGADLRAEFDLLILASVILLFVFLVVWTRYLSLGSIIAAALLPVGCWKQAT